MVLLWGFWSGVETPSTGFLAELIIYSVIGLFITLIKLLMSHQIINVR